MQIEEGKKLESYPFYRTLRLAGEDSTLLLYLP
jgi:hypothetical protein